MRRLSALRNVDTKRFAVPPPAARLAPASASGSRCAARLPAAGPKNSSPAQTESRLFYILSAIFLMNH
jgi:hypothetical protein